MSPWIQEITLPAPYRNIPNQTFFRDPAGTLFIGKANGLNIIEGKESSYHHLEGPVHVCGDASDTLYYASRNDFGYFIREGKGSFRKVSRIHLLPASKRRFIPLGIQDQSGLLHIYTKDAILQYTGKKVNILEPNVDLKSSFAPDTALDGLIKELMAGTADIPANEIRQIFQWGNSEIWILGTYTLHQIYLPSPLYTLDFGSISPGRIHTSMLFKDEILLGTSLGIFRLSRDPLKSGQWDLKDLLPEIQQSVHLFSFTGDQVFAGGSKGLYLLGKEHAELIDRGSYTGILAFQRGQLLASNQEGIIKYELTGDGWESILLSRELPHSHSFTTYYNHTYFLCKNEVYTIDSKDGKISPVPVPTDESVLKIQKVGPYLYLIGGQKAYRYDINEEVFHPLPPGKLKDLLLSAHKIIPSNTNQFWILGYSEDYLYQMVLADSLDQSPDNYQVFPVLNHLGEITNMETSDSLLFLTGKDRISIFTLHFQNKKAGGISIEFPKKEAGTAVKGFRIAGFELQTLPEPLFRYRFLPIDTLWSRWNSDRYHDLSELRHGNYTLEVQAMDLFGRIVDSVPGQLIIPTPFYARWYAYLCYAILLLSLLASFRKWRQFTYQRAESRIAERMENKIQRLAEEKERSDKLLTEMLPEVTASQIIKKGKASWDKYERATVLFSDIQGFTRIAEEMNPEKLIDELDSFFFHFDSVVTKYNIEKIKTIGDAYMAAGGIPNKNSTNPVEVVMAALEMQAYMKQLKATRARIWDLRIGIHTGPVIAGVVGHKKISYDIWGDTVNTASRMESSGTPGKINISGITYGMVKDYFLCEYRGKLPVKYKGNIDMYYVNGLRPELAVDLMAIPNRRFFMKLQLLRLGDLEEKVFKDILNKFPDSLHFHRPEYARRVYNQTFLLCRAEEVEQEGRLLARTAALMLFTGLHQSYHNFENRSIVLCREILPEFAYSETQIDQICNLILATKKPQDPNNQLEKILIDARMEYLGRPDYISEMELLLKELKETGSKINGQQFKKQQLELLYDFDFYTTAARRLREVSGEDQMKVLEKERWI